jgi:hypothetical protein
MKALDIVALVLLVVGGLNWGLVAVANFDLVAFIVGEQFGQVNIVSRIIYALVALSAIYEVVALPSLRRRWTHSEGGQHAMA